MSTHEISARGWNIVGHEHAIDILRRALAAQQIRHAYLLVGPPRIGKTLLARRLAQTLLCTGGPDPAVSPQDPCNTCLACRKVLHGNHPDVHIIEKAPDKQFILIEQIRELQNLSARRTMEGRRNIFIIPDAQYMNLQAANCLLKTLEEPEPDVVLILTVPEPGLLLPTILSRVQMLSLQLLTATQIKQALIEGWQVEAEHAELVSALAAGRMGWAIQAIEDDEMLDERREHLEQLAMLPTLSRVERFDYAQKITAADRIGELGDLLELWLLWWRDLLLASNNCVDLIVNADMRDLLMKQAAKLPSTVAEQTIKNILKAREAIEQNVNPRIALEVLMLDLPAFNV
uniref:DNA polymerase III subunit delta' n=1 Tax=Thermosporothrix sp. COM3 TaxID=2490863 RepID=A0A455SP27_9CHLR|nr:DNA polymerase III subunit delta' [Thermosporothrix sp. COM3]